MAPLVPPFDIVIYAPDGMCTFKICAIVSPVDYLFHESRICNAEFLWVPLYSLVVLLIRPDMSSTTSGTLKKMVVELQLFRWLNFLYYLIIWVINISMHVDIDSALVTCLHFVGSLVIQLLLYCKIQSPSRMQF
jgi:hypothetical protein